MNKKISKTFLFNLPKNAVGNNSKEKILQVKKLLNKNKIDLLLVTAPENVAWILNIRGSRYLLFSNSKCEVIN